MKKTILLLFILFQVVIYAQTPRIKFTYDAAGNQILRKYCSNCSGKLSEPTKELSKLQDSDLNKFFPEDVISYYPNPVKDELFLKWDLINDNKVDNIVIFNLLGKTITTLNNFSNKNETIISFQALTDGVYFVNLNYADGDIKTIKIVKEKQ